MTLEQELKNLAASTLGIDIDDEIDEIAGVIGPLVDELHAFVQAKDVGTASILEYPRLGYVRMAMWPFKQVVRRSSFKTRLALYDKYANALDEIYKSSDSLEKYGVEWDSRVGSVVRYFLGQAQTLSRDVLTPRERLHMAESENARLRKTVAALEDMLAEEMSRVSGERSGKQHPAESPRAVESEPVGPLPAVLEQLEALGVVKRNQAPLEVELPDGSPERPSQQSNVFARAEQSARDSLQTMTDDDRDRLMATAIAAAGDINLDEGGSRVEESPRDSVQAMTDDDRDRLMARVMAVAKDINLDVLTSPPKPREPSTTRRLVSLLKARRNGEYIDELLTSRLQSQTYAKVVRQLRTEGTTLRTPEELLEQQVQEIRRGFAESGMSFEELARKSCVNPGSLRKLLEGTPSTRVRVGTLIRVIVALRISFTGLLWYKETPAQLAGAKRVH